jgi:hypothetical protein
MILPNRNWRTYADKVGGEEAARSDFEGRVCLSAINAKHNCEAFVVRGTPGDGGVDFVRYEGSNPHGYQAKFWLTSFGKSQHDQINRSVKMAATWRTASGDSLKSYTLMVSVTFSQEDHKWWQSRLKVWKKTCGLTVDLIDGKNLLAIGDTYNLTGAWFRDDPKSIDVVLSSRDRIQTAWKGWARQQRPLSPRVGSMLERDRVKSPLVEPWGLFLKAQRWASELKDKVDNLSAKISEICRISGIDRGPFDDFEAKVAEVAWGGAYEQIATKIGDAIYAVVRELQFLVRESAEEGNSFGPWHGSLEKTREHAIQIQRAAREPRYNCCFLVSGGHGSGKSFFVDSLVEEAITSNVLPAVLVFPKWHLGVGGVEHAILDELERVFRFSGANALVEVESHFAKADIRLVVVIDDLQRCFDSSGTSPERILSFIKDSSRLHGIYWLVTINDMSYGRIATKSYVWSQYAYELQGHSNNCQHSGWLQVDDINLVHAVSEKMIVAYQQVGDLWQTLDQQVHSRVMQHLSSPLITLIGLEISTVRGVALFNINYIDVLSEFWKIKLQGDGAVVGYGPLHGAVALLAGVLRRQRAFEIDRSEAERLLGEIGRFASLEILWQQSLLRIEEPSLPSSALEDIEEPKVHLLCEIVWAHVLAEAIERDWWEGSGQVGALAFEQECARYESESTRDLVAQHALLLADRRRDKEYIKYVDGVWARCRASRSLAPAVYFAAAKSSVRRQRLVFNAIKKGCSAKHPERATGAEQVFAVMYFLSSCDEIKLKECLAVLRDWSRQDRRPYQLIANWELGDYFWFLIKKRLKALDTVSDCMECLSLLANCHVTGVAGAVAAEIWGKCFELADVGVNGWMPLIGAIEGYLAADHQGAREENRTKRPEGIGGAPFYLRECFLGRFFGSVIRGWAPSPPLGRDRGTRLASLFDVLQGKGWFEKGTFDEHISHQVRKRWSLQCGYWYRQVAVTLEDREEFVGLVERVIEQGDGHEWDLAFFMMRNTAPVSDADICEIDPCFLDPVGVLRKKVPALFERYPVNVRQRRGRNKR